MLAFSIVFLIKPQKKKKKKPRELCFKRRHIHCHVTCDITSHAKFIQSILFSHVPYHNVYHISFYASHCIKIYITTFDNLYHISHYISIIYYLFSSKSFEYLMHHITYIMFHAAFYVILCHNIAYYFIM